MITLAPGPSQISPETKKDISRAVQEGVLEMSHRSRRFTDISRLCIEGLREYMKVPKGYRIFYFDSASQVWHSIMTNVVKNRSFHFVNGSFSEKVREASHLMGQYVLSSEAPWGVPCDFSAKIPSNAEV